MIIEVNHNEIVSVDTRQNSNSNILKIIPDDSYVVLNDRFGLQIYCNIDDFPITCNELLSCYKCENYRINLYSGKNYNHELLIIRPNSRVRLFGKTNKEKQIGKFELVRSPRDFKINYSCNEILSIMNLRIALKEYDKLLPVCGISDKISQELSEKIVEKLDSICIDDESSIIVIQSINSLKDEFIQKSKLILSNNEFYIKNFPKYSRTICHPGNIINLYKSNDPHYYETVLKSIIEHICKPKLERLDVRNKFTLSDILNKTYSLEDEKEIIEDLSKVLRCNLNEGIYILKSYDSVKRTQYLKYTNEEFCKRIFTKKRISEKGFTQKTIWDVFIENINLFNIRGQVFYSEDKSLISLFQGYEHEILEKVDMNIIKPFLNHIRLVICNEDEKLYNYVNSWIASLIQNPGKKLEVALAIIGNQGCGKTIFTDVLCDLMNRYSERNITKMEELTGKFNAVLENKMLIVVNELKGSYEGDVSISSDFNELKSIITDKQVRINEKKQPRRTAENVTNLIFVSNHKRSLAIERDDRRHCIMECNPVAVGNRKYFYNLF